MNRNTGMIITGITALLCGCCSLFSCVWGVMTVTGAQVDQPIPPAGGYALLCLSGIAILIPLVVGFFTLRQKPEATPMSDEPLPPAS